VKAQKMVAQQALLSAIKKMRSLLLNVGFGTQSFKEASLVKSAVADPMFPITFLLRNVMALEMEPRWQSLSLRTKRALFLKMLAERSHTFCEVRDWLRLRGEIPEFDSSFLAKMEQADEDATYCRHCGGCCEIASGLAEFPEKFEIPDDWRELFGRGLGTNHRFCAFLWEINGQGMSICAIHKWRPNPCRLFAAEECRYLMGDPSFSVFLDRSRLIEASLLLGRLLDSRQFPS